MENQKLLDWIIENGFLGMNSAFYVSKAIEYATFLISIYGGDSEIIENGIVLSETKEVNKKFYKNNEGFQAIRDVLFQVGLVEERIQLLLADQYSVKRAISIEEKIIRDSSLVSWYGEVGIIKMLDFSNNEGISLIQAVEVLRNRKDPFFFPETITLTEKENKLTNYFLGNITRKCEFKKSYQGKYIILEGNSGVGKDVQAKRLEENLSALGKKVIIVQEPTFFFRNLEKQWNEENGKIMSVEEPIFRMYAIIGDRQRQIHKQIIEALKEGYVVISIRSYLSMLVYQCGTEDEQLLVNYLHQFTPRPDCVIIYDLDEQIGFERIKNRGSCESIYDKLSGLKKHRPKYLQLLHSSFLDFPIEMIDADKSIGEIAKETLLIVQKFLD